MCWQVIVRQIHKSLSHAKGILKSNRENGLVGLGIVIRIVRLPVQTPLGAWLGLETPPHYEAPGYLRIKMVKME